MRRSSPICFVAIALLFGTYARIPLAQTAGKSASKAQSQKKTPRIPIPGVGGAAPPRRKSAATAAPLIPMVPGAGPLLPQNPGRFPAPVVGPGQVPGLPGLPGLQARQINPLLFGVALPTLPTPPAKGPDPLPGLLRTAGVTNVRLTIRWSDVEKAKGKLDWNETDRSVRTIAKYGFPIVATVEGSPEWTGQPGLPSGRVAPDLERFAFVLASRYRGAVNLWEFWSEPDAGPAWPSSVPALRGRSGPAPISSYADLLQAFSRGVKRANGQAPVAVGGLGLHDTRFLSELYQMGVGASFDAVALHPSTPRDAIDFAWIDAAKPIWITDWGWSTAVNRPDSVTELRQARLVRQSLEGMRDRPYVVLANYRSLADWRKRPHDPGSLAVTGLLSQSLQPKPAFVAFREVATGLNALPAARIARVPLVGPLSQSEEAGVRGSSLQVVVDASKSAGPLARVWEGLSQEYEPAIPTLSAELARPLKALNSRIVRFDPFPNPEWVQPDRFVIAQGADGRAAPPGFTIRWQYPDSIMDALDAAGAKGMLAFATMPTGLSSPAPNPRMPRDLSVWSGFVRQVVRRYNGGGRKAVAYWELSSEPNRGGFLLEEWLRLYEAFARAVTAEDPTARVGGPAAAGFDESWLRGLAERCVRDRIPLHFLSWHASGQPPAENERQAQTARTMLKSIPGLERTELIVSEWNASARVSPDNDSVAGASRVASAIEAMINGGVDLALYDALREGPDPRRHDARLTGRWGLLTHDDRPKAAYNLFRLLAKLGSERITASSEETEVHALASRSADRVSILLWSDPADRTEAERLDSPLSVRLGGLAWKGATRGELWVIDPQHGDISAAPDRAALEPAAGFTAPAGDIELPVVLPPHGICLIELRPGPSPTVDLSLDTTRYVVYGGSRIPLVATIHNPSAQTRTLSLALAGRDLPSGHAQRASVTLAPNETRSIPFYESAGEGEGQRFFTASASTGETASTSVKVAPPLTARLENGRIDLRPRDIPSDRSARFSVRLDNRSDRPATLGIAGGTTSVSVTVPPRQAASVPVTVAVPKDAEGIVTAPIRVVQGRRALETLTATVGIEAVARFAGSMPRINGDLAEWAEAEKLSLKPAVRDRRGSLSRLSGHAMAMWDDHALYVALALVDSEPAVGGRTADPPEIRVSVASAGEGRSATPVFIVDAERTGQRLYRQTGGRGPGTIIPAARVGAHKDGRRSTVELAIPWSELAGAAPAPGQRLAIAVRVSAPQGSGGPGLEYAGALVGDAPGRLPSIVLSKP